MTFRFLHTADWQLGKPFSAIGGDAAALLREARFEAVRRLARLASDRRAAAVLVAGDAFDSNAVSDATLHKALQAMSGFAGPWVLLPGNHDCHLAKSVWTRLGRMDAGPALIVAAEPRPLELANGAACILPAPLTSRHSTDDLTAWFEAATTPAASLRIGLAHGSVAGRLPGEADAPNPLAPERSATARLDYLALGDWHGTLEIAPRTWYSGTPEPDRFPANDPGNALLVEIDGPGLPPRVQKLRTASYEWRSLTIAFADEANPGAILDRKLGVGGDPARALLNLRLQGFLGLAGRVSLELAIERWQARYCHLRPDDRDLTVTPSLADVTALYDGGIIGRVARRLGEQAMGDAGEDRVEAEQALCHLWRLVGQVPAA